jgi:Universal stress protein UspA and related nucleotide-binding proteins
MDNARLDRIVIGIDFSAPSISAARWASSWISKDAELVLVQALVVPEVSGTLALRLPFPASLIENAKTGAERRLRKLGDTLGTHSISIEAREGRPADVIAEVAREYDADLIIVGKNGEGGVHSGFTGRTADHLVRSAPSPVLVASGYPNGAPRRIVVPLTYSSMTPFIIEWTRRLYEVSRSEIFVVHVIGSGVLSHVLTMSAIKTGKELTDAEIDMVFSEDKERWKKELVSSGIPESRIKVEVVFGEVSDAIMNAVKEHQAEMVVMGSHAGPLRRLLLGSAASAVLRQAEIPVVIVIEPKPEESSGGYIGATSGQLTASLLA